MGIESSFSGSSPAIPLNIDSLNEKLKLYFHDITEPSLQKNKENYLANVKDSRELQALIRDYPDYFDLIFYTASDRVYSPAEVKVIAQNIRARNTEVVKNGKELKQRISDNPYATEDEYNVGLYREQLETQARDAVFELYKKGYRPTGSGFYDLLQGTQAIFLQAQGVNIDLIRTSLSSDIIVTENNGQIAIIFKPQSGATIQDLKAKWDNIAGLIPPNPIAEGGNSDNGIQGVKFRKNQDKLQEEKSGI
ncbi:MAG: hypothetical protein EXS50_03425 [Candidatus Taylorbacteria bacterium]|nr:hypothetical protein [Candidatus Taylorbacteria bacterium]